jgi:hypothetical protein
MADNQIVPRHHYDPSQVAIVGVHSRYLFEPIGCRLDTDTGVEYVTVRLTTLGNQALRQLCHTAEQKHVWRFPCYDFTIVKNSIRAEQVSSLLSRTMDIL